MAIYSRGDTSSNLPAIQQSSQLASKDLGTIIVKSMETIAESLADDDVPVHYKDIERAVTTGVNKSDLVKKGMKGGQVTPGGKADAALAAKYEQEKFIKWQEYQKKLQRQDELDRQRKQQAEERAWKETQAKVQAGFNSVVTSLDNPLKTMSNLIDKTVKDFSSGFLQGFKDARAGKKEDNGTTGSVSSSQEISTINTQISDLSDLIQDNFDEIKSNQTDTIDNLEDLIKDDGNTKQEKDKQEAEKAEEKKDRDKQLNATQSIGYVVGSFIGKIAGWAALIVGALAVGSQIYMWLKGKLYTWLAEMPVKRDIAIAEIRANVEAIPKRLQLAGERLLSQVHFPGFSFGGISSEEKDELKDLKKDKDLKDYIKATQKADKSLNTMASQMGASGVSASDYNLTTEEGRNEYKAAVIASAKQSRIENGMPELNEEYASAEIDKWLENRINSQPTLTAEIKEKAERYEDLLARSKKGPMSESEYERRKGLIAAEQEGRKSELVEEAIAKRVSNGTLTEFQAETFKNQGYAGQVENVMQQYQDNHEGKEFSFAQATAQERWVNEKYKPWEQAYKDLGHNMQLDLNIDTTRGKDNPLNTNR